MALLTIGAFAQATRLSPKALRLYDHLGLLRPAETNPLTGYRRYAPEQLGREADMTGNRETLTLRYAARTDRGLVRDRNHDAVWAGEGLVAVADGFGPSTDTALASSVALDALGTARTAAPAGALLDTLRTATEHAVNTVVELVTSDATFVGAGTTLTALAWSDSELALVHVGDSRAYPLRDGDLLRLTHDDTLVQGLIDAGTLTTEEAESHPQRSILIRAIHQDATTRPDVRAHHALVGDRYLLCSDGLHTVLSPTAIRDVLATRSEPDAAVTELIELVRRAGAPDNVACVVADVLPG
ncbi:MAG: MerR family transcriptional regulator [Pseudonocardiaceae bacterium]